MKKLFILSVACFLLSCSKKQETKPVVAVDSTTVETPAPEQPKVNIWSSSSTGLPVGTIVKMDCAGCATSEKNYKDNYVTIRKSDGVNEIVKDIDEDVFLNINNGDIIQ